jgi:hypothetical protein
MFLWTLDVKSASKFVVCFFSFRKVQDGFVCFPMSAKPSLPHLRVSATRSEELWYTSSTLSGIISSSSTNFTSRVPKALLAEVMFRNQGTWKTTRLSLCLLYSNACTLKRSVLLVTFSPCDRSFPTRFRMHLKYILLM